MEIKLLHKTELYLSPISLREADLEEIARIVAEVLDLQADEVLVVDVRTDVVTLDILKESLSLDSILARERDLLEAVSLIPGVIVTAATEVHSEGVLGLVKVHGEQASGLSEFLQNLNQEIKTSVNKRVIIFPTGSEIISGEIEDANTPFLLSLMDSAGYIAETGPPLEDNLDLIIGALNSAVEQGYGLVITTGGTGAEDKDFMVEGISALDPDAATPYVVHYQLGQGRHKKDGVRVAVGEVGWTRLVALTGPHREVQMAAPILMQGLTQVWDKTRLAHEIAGVLQRNLPVGHNKINKH